MNDLVVYHGDCVDGFTAAWCVRHVVGDGATFVPARYGETPALGAFEGFDRIYIVDFSYPRDVLEAINEKCPKLRVIDHHKTAEEDLRGLDFCTFDMERSGAGLAWDEVVRPAIWDEPMPRPWLVNYAEDRDLWRFNLPDSRAVNAFLRSQPQDFETWDKLASMELGSAVGQGYGCQSHIDAYVRAACKHWYMADMGGQRFPMVNVTYESCSEVADELLRRHGTDMAGYYFERGDGKIQYGFRSRDGFDVGDFARQFGGGGHAAAYGCVAAGILHDREDSDAD